MKKTITIKEGKNKIANLSKASKAKGDKSPPNFTRKAQKYNKD